jgi:hypothetical protein
MIDYPDNNRVISWFYGAYNWLVNIIIKIEIMKKVALIIIILFNFLIAFTQKSDYCLIDFENSNCNRYEIWIDTLSNPYNIWQIGKPEKSIFQQSYSKPNAIITDREFSYPINDTSSFYIVHFVDSGLAIWNLLHLSFYYKLNTDSLSDYGLIEFSPDNGKSWLNAMEDKVNFRFLWNSNPKYNSLTGKTDEWESIGLFFTNLDHVYSFKIGDTVLWKFTFISDSIQTSKDGWMLDNIEVSSVFNSINEEQKSEISIYPNPTSEELYIHYPYFSNFNIEGSIHDILGYELREFKISGIETKLNISDFDSGIYFVKIIIGDKQVVKKIVKE